MTLQFHVPLLPASYLPSPRPQETRGSSGTCSPLGCCNSLLTGLPVSALNSRVSRSTACQISHCAHPDPLGCHVQGQCQGVLLTWMPPAASLASPLLLTPPFCVLQPHWLLCSPWTVPSVLLLPGLYTCPSPAQDHSSPSREWCGSLHFLHVFVQMPPPSPQSLSPLPPDRLNSRHHLMHFCVFLPLEYQPPGTGAMSATASSESTVVPGM